MSAQPFQGRPFAVALAAAVLVAHGPAAHANAAIGNAAAPDAAAQLSAALGDSGGLLGGSLPMILLTFGGFVLGGLRLSRGIIRASGSLARTTKRGGGSSEESFEARLAAGLRELEQATPVPPATISDRPTAPPAPRAATGTRTFGRRAS